MIVAGTHLPVNIDLGKDEPGVTLQRRDVKNGYIEWRDYTVDGEVVKSPVDNVVRFMCRPTTVVATFANSYVF